jgi:two-component system LytT family response regulator
MITTIIIDDEQHAADRLSRLLTAYHKDEVEIAGIFSSVEEGLSGIRSLKPGLVFLDVQLRDKTGFDLLQALPHIDFPVVFTTAFEEYAVRAFRFSAVDYLLKPVDADDLSQALAKVKKNRQKDEIDKKLETLFHNMQHIQGASKKITVPTANGLTVLAVGDILRCQANANYTVIYLKDNQKMVVARTLKEFEELLGDYNFFRVHHSHLINLAFVKRYSKGKGGQVYMSDHACIEVSTRRKDEFLKKLAAL